MSKKFEALQNRMLLVEEVERLTRAESIEEVTPLSVIQEHNLVSSFLLMKEETLYALGVRSFGEIERHLGKVIEIIDGDGHNHVLQRIIAY